MPRFDKLHPLAPASPVTTARSELVLLAVVNLVGEDTFHEAAADRDERFRRLVHEVALDDPDWVARFVPYLRDTLNLRSASLVMAAEYARALLAGPRPVDAPSPRSVITSAIRRADEPAELLAYWTARYGRRVPMAVKRGVADAVRRLWTERAALKLASSTPLRLARTFSTGLRSGA